MNIQKNELIKDICGFGLYLVFFIQILFIILKLCDVINWSWLVVYIPLFVLIILIGILCFTIMIIGFILAINEKKEDK